MTKSDMLLAYLKVDEWGGGSKSKNNSVGNCPQSTS